MNVQNPGCNTKEQAYCTSSARDGGCDTRKCTPCENDPEGSGCVPKSCAAKLGCGGGVTPQASWDFEKCPLDDDLETILRNTQLSTCCSSCQTRTSLASAPVPFQYTDRCAEVCKDDPESMKCHRCTGCEDVCNKGYTTYNEELCQACGQTESCDDKCSKTNADFNPWECYLCRKCKDMGSQSSCFLKNSGDSELKSMFGDQFCSRFKEYLETEPSSEMKGCAVCSYSDKCLAKPTPARKEEPSPTPVRKEDQKRSLAERSSFFKSETTKKAVFAVGSLILISLVGFFGYKFMTSSSKKSKRRSK